MKKNILALFFCLIFFGFESLQCTEETTEKADPPMFVSLGSHCEVAQQIAHNRMRSASFPFDWLLTCDYQGFIALFEEDFAFFMEKSCLEQHPVGNIINRRYNIDFRHDWLDIDFETHFLDVREKYERRVERFKQLNSHQGKVFFIRAAFDLCLNPLLPTLTRECTKIESTHAEALRNSLNQKFPDLDFNLVIINYTEERAPDIVGMEKVLEFKVRKSHKQEDYTAIIQSLLEHADQKVEVF